MKHITLLGCLVVLSVIAITSCKNVKKEDVLARKINLRYLYFERKMFMDSIDTNVTKRVFFSLQIKGDLTLSAAGWAKHHGKPNFTDKPQIKCDTGALLQAVKPDTYLGDFLFTRKIIHEIMKDDYKNYAYIVLVPTYNTLSGTLDWEINASNDLPNQLLPSDKLVSIGKANPIPPGHLDEDLNPVDE